VGGRPSSIDRAQPKKIWIFSFEKNLFFFIRYKWTLIDERTQTILGRAAESLRPARPLITILVQSWSQIDLENSADNRISTIQPLKKPKKKKKNTDLYLHHFLRSGR